MSSPWRRLLDSPIVQLCALHHRALVREPSNVFFIFVVPLILSLLLGYAFASGAPDQVVGIAEQAGAEAVLARLEGATGLRPVRLPLEEARARLDSGRIGVVLVPGDPVKLIADTSLAEGRTARLMVLEALARSAGAGLPSGVVEEPVRATRARYIDFLIPGLIAFTLMNASMFGLGFSVVTMRIGKMLKRLTATSMRKSTFLGSMLLTRVFQVLLEVGFIVLLARVFFGVQVAGNHLDLLAFALVGAFCFAGVGLLAGSRTRNAETAGGIFNLVTVPMSLVSGIFFSTAGFPDWLQPLVRYLPLAALADGLRAIMVDGVTLGSQTFAMTVLLVWGTVTFGVAVKVLRWE